MSKVSGSIRFRLQNGPHKKKKKEKRVIFNIWEGCIRKYVKTFSPFSDRFTSVNKHF